MKPDNILPIPPPVIADDDAVEALRVFRTKNNSAVMMVRVDTFEDPFTWGMILVDAARHVAKGAVEGELTVRDKDGTEHAVNEEEVLERIREGFDAEWENSTDPGRE